MKAVIMAGGFGTRLKPLTIHRPKPMVPVANRPLMEHIVDLVRRHGITELVSILYFQPEQITDYFGDGSAFGVRMQYVTATADYGTAGAVRNAADLIAGERILVISGDVLTDFDLGALLQEHDARGAEATIALTSVENPLAFGIVIADRETGRIERFLEKPTWGEVFSDTINTGIYVLEPSALAGVAPETNVDFSRDVFPQMLREGAALYGHLAQGYWRDVGNLNEYRRAHDDVLAGRIGLALRGERREQEGAVLWGEPGAMVAGEARLGGTVLLGRNVEVGRGATLENVVAGAGSVIGAGAELRDVVLWEGCRIGAEARLSETICAGGVRVGQGALVRENCILSDRSEVGALAVVGPNVKVWPDKVVEERAVLTHSLIWGEAWERSLFHGARVSGIPNAELTPEIATRLGGAFGAMLGPGAYVAASRDSDRASRMINRALITGFLSVGVNVEDLREMPIPVVRHAVNHGREAGGIHVRRSPFDPKVVDILFFDADGRDLPPAKTQSIERLFAREDFPRAGPDGTGALNFPTRVVEGYREHFLSEVGRELIAERKFTLVVDFAYGTSVAVFPGLLGELRTETVSLDAYAAPGRLSRSEEEFRESLIRLGGIVRSIDADLGLWIDPGGEVIHLVDDTGRALSPELAQAAYIGLALEHLGVQRVAIPVTSPAVVARTIRASGAELVWTKTEHHAMMGSATDVDLVAGVRGEFIFPHFIPAYDGMFAAIRLLEALGRAGLRLSEVAGRYPAIEIRHGRVACPWGRKGAVMRRLIEETEGEERQLVDGVKIWKSEEEWVLLIPHSDKPYFVVTAEGADGARAEQLLAEYSRKLAGWRDEG
jgi:mannose-1-phosphate guanylyltransferase/phosphomannomutase